MQRRRRRARDTGKETVIVPQRRNTSKCGELSSERSAILRDYPISPARKKEQCNRFVAWCTPASADHVHRGLTVRDFHVVFTFLPSLHKWTTSVQVIKTRAKDNNDFCLVERS
eukprot:gene7782-biopygen6074